MPRTANISLTAGQAQYVVTRLMKDRRVSAGQIRSYLGDLRGEIDALEAQLEALKAASGDGAARRGRRAAAAPAAAPAAGRKRRRQNLSPERRAALKLQGQYLALVRQVPARARAKFKQIFHKKGVQGAIDALRKAVK